MVSTEPSFYWFDYETFGISPAWDKPAQFAGQRTSIDLKPIGDPIILYCKPPADYLPNPHACRVTQMQPDDIANRGVNEAQFIKQVVAELGRPEPALSATTVFDSMTNLRAIPCSETFMMPISRNGKTKTLDGIC